MTALDYARPIPGQDVQLATIADWETFFGPLYGDGVVSGMAPTMNSGARTVTLAPGVARVRAYVAAANTAKTANVPAASAADRADRLVLRLDRSQTTEAAWITPVVIQGTPGSSVLPALAATSDGLYDIPVAHWTTKASGALAGLVDDRPFLAGPTVVYSGTGTPPTPGPGRVLLTPTQVLVSRNGSSWDTVLWADTGWVSLPLNGADAAAWSAFSSGPRARLLNGMCHVLLAVQRYTLQGLGAGDQDGSVPVTLPSQFRPAYPEPGGGFAFSPAPSSLAKTPVGLTVQTNGDCTLFALISSVDLGWDVRVAATYPAG